MCKSRFQAEDLRKEKVEEELVDVVEYDEAERVIEEGGPSGVDWHHHGVQGEIGPATEGGIHAYYHHPYPLQ